jgi:hypothetical protein
LKFQLRGAFLDPLIEKVMRLLQFGLGLSFFADEFAQHSIAPGNHHRPNHGHDRDDENDAEANKQAAGSKPTGFLDQAKAGGIRQQHLQGPELCPSHSP